jgi:DNA polymerase I-like protein with 3'-5' exonuclease and polymerase domains
MDLDGVRFVPFVMHTIYQTLELNEHEQKYLKYLNKKDVITEWLSNQNLYFKKSYLNERIKFKKLLNGIQYTTLEYSNKRTITGRINCCDKRFNPQMLDKKSEDRAAIVSQYKNGKIVTFDYTSFEIKLALFLCQDEAFIIANKDKDLHAETAKILYNKLDITIEERSIGKSINNTLLYGGGQELILSKMNGVVNSEIKLEEVKKFLEPILEMRQRISDSCKEFGYLINVFGSIIRPEKSWAIFNNFMQALAADILVEKLFLIRDFLSKHKTVFLFQVHDSFIFDFHPDEMFLIDEITIILSSFEKIILPVNHCVGESWQDCTKN